MSVLKARRRPSARRLLFSQMAIQRHVAPEERTSSEPLSYLGVRPRDLSPALGHAYRTLFTAFSRALLGNFA